MSSDIADGAVARCLLFRARELLCACPLEHVAESMRPLPIEPLADMPPFVLGLAVIRGSPSPVVDIGALLGADQPPSTTRFVTLKTGPRVVAIAVEEIVGIGALARATLHDMPPLLREAAAEVVAAVGVLDREFFLVLQTAHLIPEALWPALHSA